VGVSYPAIQGYPNAPGRTRTSTGVRRATAVPPTRSASTLSRGAPAASPVGTSNATGPSRLYPIASTSYETPSPARDPGRHSRRTPHSRRAAVSPGTRDRPEVARSTAAPGPVAQPRLQGQAARKRGPLPGKRTRRGGTVGSGGRPRRRR